MGLVPARLDRLASRRHGIDGRDFEVAVDREGEGARDRRRGHHEEMRIRALLAQFRALEDAEAVLLIDHGEAKARDFDARFEEGVRADEDVRAAVRSVPAGKRLLRGRERPGDENSAHGPPQPRRHLHAIECAVVRTSEEAHERAVMLFREDLRGGHDHRLVAGSDRSEGSREGDNRFARADISLEKAEHGHRAADVAQDLGKYQLLGGSQGEWQ